MIVSACLFSALLLLWVLCGLGAALNKGNTFINHLLLHLFNNSDVANIGDATGIRGSTVAGSLYLSLHTADPGVAGNQTTSEAAYTNYARQAVARSSSGFTVSGQSVTLNAAISFPAGATGDTDVLMFWAVGSGSSGTGELLYSGPIGSNLGAGTATTADVITIPGLTGVSVGDRIVFTAPTGGTIPSGITVGTVYFVKTVSTNDITISTTSGGSTLDITAAGQVLAYKVTPITMGGGLVVTPQLTTGTTITEK